MGELDEKANRAIREGLNDETLALFDILMKPSLEKKDIERIKNVADELLAVLKNEKLRMDHWREKESTRDAVLITINNFLSNDQTGLPFIKFLFATWKSNKRKANPAWALSSNPSSTPLLGSCKFLNAHLHIRIAVKVYYIFINTSLANNYEFRYV